MATRSIGTDRRSRTKFVALLVVLAIAASVLAVQARSFLSTTSNAALRSPSVIVLNELPTGPQHGRGPHPHEIDSLTVLATIATAAYAATPEVVLDDPAVRESTPSASDGYLVWSANSEAKPNRYHSYVMAGAGSPVRIDPAGTQSRGAAIDGTTIVYEASTSEEADLGFFDAVTEVRSDPPAGVNTPGIELRPTLSGDWLLFTRTNQNRVSLHNAWRKVVLFNVSTSASIVLQKVPFRTTYLVSDQVNGDWATFESCNFRQKGFEYFDCEVFRYQISTDDLVQIENPGVPQQQYAGAVSGDGTVYLVRTRNRDHWECGDHARLIRYPVGGPGVVIAELPDGKDALTTFALDETGGSTTMYFDRFTCSNGRDGIYRIPDADTAA